VSHQTRPSRSRRLPAAQGAKPAPGRARDAGLVRLGPSSWGRQAGAVRWPAPWPGQRHGLARTCGHRPDRPVRPAFPLPLLV